MTQNKKIAVTGGIGSGKSEFCRILKHKGYPVFSCDEISDELWQSEDYTAGLKELFPACKTKREIATFVFRNEAALARLNAYAHPRIMEELLRRMEGEICFAEVPLLFEGGYESLFDGVIALIRPAEARIAAVQARDGLGREEIVARMQKQFDPAALAQKNCILIENDGDLTTLAQKADEAIARIRKL